MALSTYSIQKFSVQDNLGYPVPSDHFQKDCILEYILHDQVLGKCLPCTFSKWTLAMVAGSPSNPASDGTNSWKGIKNKIDQHIYFYQILLMELNAALSTTYAHVCTKWKWKPFLHIFSHYRSSFYHSFLLTESFPSPYFLMLQNEHSYLAKACIAL